MRVIVADDSMLLREGVVRVLEDAGFDVVGQAWQRRRAHAPDQTAQARRGHHRPPNATDLYRRGSAAALAIRAEIPETAVLVLSQYIEDQYALELLGQEAAGVGYLLKGRVSDLERFTDAVRRVAEGGSALDPDVVSQMLGRRRIVDPLAALTPREHEVLALMAQGRSNQSISEVLVIFENARWRST